MTGERSVLAEKSTINNLFSKSFVVFYKPEGSTELKTFFLRG